MLRGTNGYIKMGDTTGYDRGNETGATNRILDNVRPPANHRASLPLASSPKERASL